MAKRKRTTNDPHNTTQKTKDGATRTSPLKPQYLIGIVICIEFSVCSKT